MFRQNAAYHDTTIDVEETGLEYLTEPPTKEDYQQELTELLNDPGRYPRENGPTFNGTAEFTEGRLLMFESTTEDGKSGHNYTPKERILTEVLETAANHAKFFNDEERNDFAAAITELATQEQTGLKDKYPTFYYTTPASQKQYDDYLSQVQQLVDHAIDIDYANRYTPYQAAKEILYLSRDRTDYQHDTPWKEPFHDMTFQEKAQHYGDSYDSSRDYLVTEHLTNLMGPNWENNSNFRHQTREALLELYHHEMSQAMLDDDQTQFNHTSVAIEKVAHMAQYATDRNTFLAYSTHHAEIEFAVDENSAMLYRPGGEDWQFMNDRIEQMKDPDLQAVAYKMLENTADINFYEEDTKKTMYQYVALSEFMQAHDNMTNAQASYVRESEADHDAHFTRLNVNTEYLYQHAFDSPGQDTSEAERMVYNNIANSVLSHLKYAQEMGDAERFQQTMDFAKATAAEIGEYNFEDLQYYGRNAAHDDPTNHNVRFVAELLELTSSLAENLRKNQEYHQLNELTAHIYRDASYHGQFLLKDHSTADDADSFQRHERYEQTIFRIQVANRAMANLADIHNQ